MREAARKWALELLETDPRVRQAGYFGSYARGTQGVGSDLDLVVVVETCDVPVTRRGLLFDVRGLPVPADLLVYNKEEFSELLASGTRFAKELAEHAVWFGRTDVPGR